MKRTNDQSGSPVENIKLPGFVFREPEDEADVKSLADVRNHGWHVVSIPDDPEGPGFSFTVGLYLRTLQPEILIMGVPIDSSICILNAIGEFLMAGGTVTPERRYTGFLDDREVLFRPIHSSQYRDHLGYANWFYRRANTAFPAYQCVWPDSRGRFPQDNDFDTRFVGRQFDLSLPRA